MPLKEQLQSDMKVAMKAGQKDRLTTIRMALAAIKQREVDERVTLDDTEIISIINKMIKQRRESFTLFAAAGRNDLSEKEASEIEILEVYLPDALSEDEVAAIIDESIKATNAASMKDMGKVMGILRPKLQGRADMSAASAQVKQRLS